MLQHCKVLRPRLERLARARAATGAELHSKFLQEGRNFELVYANLSAFFGGLEAKIGPPDPHVAQGMEREHTGAADSLDMFTTLNYGVTTTPQLEFRFVAEPDRDESWPVEAKLADAPDKRRKVMSLRGLEAALAQVNAKLREQGATTLLVEEGIGARLYTGPMCACNSTVCPPALFGAA